MPPDAAREREELLDRLWFVMRRGYAHGEMFDHAGALRLLASHDAKTAKARDLEWNDACLQATASLKSAGIPCSPTPFEIGRMLESVRASAVEECAKKLDALAESEGETAYIARGFWHSAANHIRAPSAGDGKGQGA